MNSMKSLSMENQLTMKFIITGPSAVGKSCLATQFTENYFNSSHDVTVGVEFGTYMLTLSDGQEIKLQIWDTCGQESFKAITRSYYRGAQGILLVYDITNRQTFKYLSSWLDECRTNADEAAVIVLVGNKSDADSNREVSSDEGKAFADANELLFFETSAKTSENVDEAIYLIYEKFKRGEIRIDLTKNTKKGELDNRSYQNYNATKPNDECACTIS